MTSHRAPGAPNRGPRTGRRAGRRKGAAGAILACFAAGAAWAVNAAGSGGDHPMVGAPLPPLEASAIPPCPAWSSARDLQPPAVLLYISVSCPYCRVQVATWADLIEQRGGPVPWLILAPGESPDATIPPSLRGRLLLDRSGEVGRALQLQRVPLTLHVDAEGRVRQRVEGLQRAEQLVKALDDLAFVPPSSASTECAS